MIKKLIYILIFIMTCANFAFADTKDAYLQYNGHQYKFKPGDEVKFLKNANTNILMAEKSQKITDKAFYLKEAMRYYFLLSQISPKSIEAQIGLGRVYDGIQLDKLAKKHFFTALNFDKHNPTTNLHFGNFYYTRNDLVSAFYYYKLAYNYGYSTDYYLNYRLGTICEKLADIETAKKFYANAMKISPKNPELINKLHILDGLNYSQSQYYLFNN